MTEIPDPPQQHACATCMQPLRWLWTPRRNRWVAFVPAPDGGPHAITPHTCTDRPQPQPAPPTAEYRAARAALGHRPERTDQ